MAFTLGTHPSHATAVAAGPLTASRKRWPLVVLLVGHGLIHAMGVSLLWRLGEPAELTYADSVLAPGSVPAVAAGVGWAAAGVALLVAGWLLARKHDTWRVVAVTAAIVSLPLMVTAAPAPMGVVANVVILAVILIERRLT
jgi:hypothetical protein